MPPKTPYSSDLGNQDPIAAMRETAEAVRALTAGWTSDRFERSYAPGKWTARQILMHLAQSELALGARARMALSTANYTAQPFDQDVWMQREPALSGRDALETFLVVARMNTALFESLSAADRATPLSHPEFGALTVDWIIHQMAGHQIHHVRQLEQVR